MAELKRSAALNVPTRRWYVHPGLVCTPKFVPAPERLAKDLGNRYLVFKKGLSCFLFNHFGFETLIKQITAIVTGILEKLALYIL